MLYLNDPRLQILKLYFVYIFDFVRIDTQLFQFERIPILKSFELAIIGYVWQ